MPRARYRIKDDVIKPLEKSQYYVLIDCGKTTAMNRSDLEYCFPVLSDRATVLQRCIVVEARSRAYAKRIAEQKYRTTNPQA